MFDKNKLKKLADDLLPAVFDAGEAILKIMQSGDFEVERKDDHSPVTEADEAAEAILLKAIREVAPGVPVIAEEQAEAKGLPEDGYSEFFLVDPLDGTKEFINRRDGFTVNVALIQKGISIFGLVYAPARGEIFIGLGPYGAFKAKGPGDAWQKISVRKHAKPLTIVASLSHRNPATEDYLAHYPEARIASIGSSLKFCLVAEGKADLYPRFGPTMEWDTAAGHAVLASAGGKVFNPDGTEFSYNKDGFKNGFFIAVGDPAIDFVKVKS